MATTRQTVETVDLRPARIDRYRATLDENAWSAFETTMGEFASTMRGRVLWNVNSTPRGGGVAELLAALIPYDLGAGIDERWLVIDGSPDFFNVTKKIHTLLHGVATDGSDITGAERREYERTMARNAAALAEHVKPADVVLLHDPQTAGLVPALAKQGVKVLWRSHVGVDQPNDIVRSAWRFLTPYLSAASAFVFSRRAYVWDGLEDSRVHVIAPCIDPYTPKNTDLGDHAVAAILGASGILRASDGEATFLRPAGTTGKVGRSAIVTETLPLDARIVVQVSRWDRLKDPQGVMSGFADHIAPQSDAWLVLAGPGVNSVDDDPEQPEILHRLQTARGRLPHAIRDRVVIAQLPMQDIDENAAIVNALQRRADVVVQKSLAEGFGLTVAEAMWKARPVVASRVGGIEDQIEHGKSGILVDDPEDLEAFGAAVVDLLDEPEKAGALGRNARRRIIGQFLAPRHLVEQAQLIASLL
jgi:trehalose synthase